MHIFSDINIYINIFSERVQGNLTGDRDLPELGWYLEMRSLCPLLFFIYRIESYQSLKRISNGSCVMSLLSHDSQTIPCTSFRVMSFPPCG
jgi:hypothetical protein